MPKAAKAKLPATIIKHGILSRNLLLQSECEDEYQEVLSGLYQDYRPTGATECHLVEELAGILWRKRRLRIAENAYYRRQLHHTVTGMNSSRVVYAAVVYDDSENYPSPEGLRKALTADEEENLKELDGIENQHESIIKILNTLKEGKVGYEEALEALPEEVREWWNEDQLGKEFTKGVMCQPSAEHLRHFLAQKVLRAYLKEFTEIASRSEIKAQAEGEAFIPNDALEKFSRYETYLDRKFERTLTVLLRLQEMRVNREKNLLPEKLA